MGKPTDKKTLETKLAELLGFDDGASDILEHLITIEGEKDVSEYLSQLLGGESSDILKFADNVHRFQKSDDLSYEPSANAIDDAKIAAKPKITAPKKPANLQTLKKGGKKQQQQQQQKSRVPPPKKLGTPGPTNSKDSSTKKSPLAAAPASQPEPQTSTPKTTAPVKKFRPVQGTPKVICGCFGMVHEALTNCLYCGRISCSREGYGYCGFCRYEVREVEKGDIHADDKAWAQKERLLTFDRDFAQRTQIFDDQADFQGPSTWMTEEEREEAEEKELAHKQSLKRQPQTLNIAL